MKLDFLSKQNLLKLLGDTGADVKRFADREVSDLAELVYDQIVRHVYPESGSTLQSFGIEPSAVPLKKLLAGIDSLHARLSAAEKEAATVLSVEKRSMVRGMRRRIEACEAWIRRAQSEASPMLQALSHNGGVHPQALMEAEDRLMKHLATEPEGGPVPSKPTLDHSAMLEEIQKKVCVRKFWICNAGIGMFWLPYTSAVIATAVGDAETRFAVYEYYDTLADCIECEYAVHVLGQPRMSTCEKRGNRPAPRGPFHEEAS